MVWLTILTALILLHKREKPLDSFPHFQERANMCRISRGVLFTYTDEWFKLYFKLILLYFLYLIQSLFMCQMAQLFLLHFYPCHPHTKRCLSHETRVWTYRLLSSHILKWCKFISRRQRHEHELTDTSVSQVSPLCRDSEI